MNSDIFPFQLPVPSDLPPITKSSVGVDLMLPVKVDCPIVCPFTINLKLLASSRDEYRSKGHSDPPVNRRVSRLPHWLCSYNCFHQLMYLVLVPKVCALSICPMHVQKPRKVMLLLSAHPVVLVLPICWRS